MILIFYVLKDIVCFLIRPRDFISEISDKSDNAPLR
jgi:hypothetical protein